jgi:hypothetical protein
MPPGHANAVDRLSFLLWALNSTELDKTRSAHWKRMEEDYLRQIEAAQKEVDRIKADTALWERRVWKLDHDRPSGGDEVLAG